MLPNLQGINVHWLCPGTDADAKIESVLLRNSKALRHELSQLRVLGHIPPITFVKGKDLTALVCTLFNHNSPCIPCVS